MVEFFETRLLEIRGKIKGIKHLKENDFFPRAVAQQRRSLIDLHSLNLTLLLIWDDGQQDLIKYNTI